jgi:hypothetical protein
LSKTPESTKTSYTQAKTRYIKGNYAQQNRSSIVNSLSVL